MASGRICWLCAVLPVNCDVVGNDRAMGVLYGCYALDCDGAGDRFDDPHRRGLEVGTLGAMDIGGPDRVDEALGTRVVSRVADEDLGGLQFNVRSRPVFEV